MIHWLVGSLADHPDLARGEPPPDLLSPAEAARLGGLRVGKRRRDWILGRWTAKHLVRSALEAETHVRLPFPAFTVESGAGGPPSVVFETARPADLSLSISHAEGQAFCALTLLPSAHVGADIEWIASRHPGFAGEYFTPAELARLRAAPAALYDALVTVIWSAKEAVLKALGLGLTVDTRHVRCLVDPPADAHDPALYGYRWSGFTVELDPGLAAGRIPGLSISGWWQIMSNYALTLVLIRPGSGRIAPGDAR